MPVSNSVQAKHGDPTHAWSRWSEARPQTRLTKNAAEDPDVSLESASAFLGADCQKQFGRLRLGLQTGLSAEFLGRLAARLALGTGARVVVAGRSQRVLDELVASRDMPGRGTRDIQVGVSAGSYVALPAMALRTAGRQIKSSGSRRPLPLVDASAAFAHPRR